MTEARYYIADIDTSHYLFQWMPDWYGVVDSLAGSPGGIIAYFSDKKHAEDFVNKILTVN